MTESRIGLLKEWYNGLLSTVTIERNSQTYGFAEIAPFPPPIDFPASTLLMNQISQEDRATGGLTENGWEFIHSISVDYSGQDAAALEELELFIEAVQTRVRRLTPDEMTLQDGTPVVRVDLDASRFPGDAETPFGTRIAFKEFLVTAVTEEI